MILLDKYMAIPYSDNASSFKGADCYGLVRLILNNEFGKQLPDFSNLKTLTKEEKAILANTQLPLIVKEQIFTPEEGCVVQLTALGGFWHIGVCLEDFLFIHTLKQHGPCIESLTSPKWMKRIEGFYRV